MLIELTWRDLVSLVSLGIGVLSYLWGLRQARSAQDAEEAEAKVRAELYRHQVTQRVSQLSNSVLKVYSLVRTRNFAYAGEAAWELISDFSHVIGFCKQELTADERAELTRLHEECAKIAAILSLNPELDPDESDRTTITSICLDSLMHIRRLQGRLENTDENPSETPVKVKLEWIKRPTS